MSDTDQHSTPMQLRGAQALVMGLGVHGGGLGVARFLVDEGAVVTVTDLRGPETLASSLAALAGLPIRFVLGEHREQDFHEAELVVKNPGVPASSRFLQIARDHGAAIETEMTLFFRRCPGPILGITGTKGKTTTTMLAGAMLREQFPDTVVAGNLRVSALEHLPSIRATTPVVLELSSFALEDLGAAKLSPRFACVTNLSPDHLDRYATMAEYGEAKRQIFLHQQPGDVLILNQADATIAAWASDAPGSVLWCSTKRGQQAQIVCDEHGLWLSDTLVCPGDEIRLAGVHNRANIAAAAALVTAFGVKPANIRQALRSFSGVEHRLELVREIGGVRYINDTAATVPEAAIAALYSFSAPIVLICGGADKRLEFAALAQAVLARAKAVLLLDGTATPRLAQALDAASTADSPPISGPFSDFAAAVQAAHHQAQPGEIVLLSPGCASFGMFRNEFHRGEEFRRIVAGLR